MLLKLALTILLVLSGSAHAGSATTRDALDRLEELLALRVEDGRLAPEEMLPVLLVSAQPAYVETQPWYATRVIEVLQGAFGEGNLRVCEACMAPRAFVESGNLVYQTGPIGLDEVARLDEQGRGPSQAARAAVWVDEHAGGVAVRIVDLRTARVLFAQNVDPYLVEYANTQRMYSLAAELERRSRGDSLTQAFVDIGVYPGQHLSLDWTDQWGKTNANLSGFTLAIYDPVVGLGGCHYRRVDIANLLFGGKAILSLPTALVRAVGENNVDVLDPLLTVVGVVRVPFGRSNYGAILTASTNGELALGISLMNISLLPVLP